MSEDKTKSIDDLTKEWAAARDKAETARRSLEHVRSSLPYREREHAAALEAEQDAWRALNQARDAAIS